MYQPFHKLRVRFAELEMKQGEVAKRANMAESTLTARMTGRLPWNGDEIARVAKVVGIPTDQIGTFFFEGRAQGIQEDGGVITCEKMNAQRSCNPFCNT